LSGGAETILTFPVILTSGVLPGKAYEITLFARSATGRNSDTFHVTIRAQLDPVFDEGTIIGKVFNDTNKKYGPRPGRAGHSMGAHSPRKKAFVVITDDTAVIIFRP